VAYAMPCVALVLLVSRLSDVRPTTPMTELRYYWEPKRRKRQTKYKSILFSFCKVLKIHVGQK
jgi:hypothetical protein